MKKIQKTEYSYKWDILRIIFSNFQKLKNTQKSPKHIKIIFVIEKLIKEVSWEN